MKVFYWFSLSLIGINAALLGAIISNWTGTVAEGIFACIVSVAQMAAMWFADDIFDRKGKR